MMRPSLCLLLLALSTLTQAQDLVIQRQPTVVYEGHSTVVATRYYKRMERQDTEPSNVEAPAGAGVTSMAQQLPLISSALQVGRPTMQVQDGQVVPLFVMGMDSVSLNWFREAAQGLADMGARGVVVQAERRSDWLSLQQQAKRLGIDLMLLPGESLAAGYDIDTYPIVIVSPALAEEDAGE